MSNIRRVGCDVSYVGEPETKGKIVNYVSVGDWCEIEWDVSPKDRGTGWHQNHMKAFHLYPRGEEVHGLS